MVGMRDHHRIDSSDVAKLQGAEQRVRGSGIDDERMHGISASVMSDALLSAADEAAARWPTT